MNQENEILLKENKDRFVILPINHPASHKQKDLYQLLPNNWKEFRQESNQ